MLKPDTIEKLGDALGYETRLWGVWCEIWSTPPNGHRAGWLKVGGAELTFATREAAKAEAERCIANIPVHYSGEFRFTVRKR